MTTPTRAGECRKCKRWNHPMEHSDKTWFFCLKGHRPRYYLRFTVDGTPDGYRRRCEDFEEREGEK